MAMGIMSAEAARRISAENMGLLEGVLLARAMSEVGGFVLYGGYLRGRRWRQASRLLCRLGRGSSLSRPWLWHRGVGSLLFCPKVDDDMM